MAKEVPHKQVLQLLDIILPIGGELEVQGLVRLHNLDQLMYPLLRGLGIVLKWIVLQRDASPAASDNLNIQHRIEGQNLQHLLKGTSSAKKLTLSFWVKSNKTGTYIIEIFDVDNTRHICKSYTIDTTKYMEKKKELVFDGDTSGTLDNDNASSLEPFMVFRSRFR